MPNGPPQPLRQTRPHAPGPLRLLDDLEPEAIWGEVGLSDDRVEVHLGELHDAVRLAVIESYQPMEEAESGIDNALRLDRHGAGGTIAGIEIVTEPSLVAALPVQLL